MNLSRKTARADAVFDDWRFDNLGQSHFQSHVRVSCRSVVERLLFVSPLLGEYRSFYWLAGFGGPELNPPSLL